MTWTANKPSFLLTDYLDGLLQPEQQHAFDLHVQLLRTLHALVSSVTHAIASLRALPEVETPPRFVYNILDATLGRAKPLPDGPRFVHGSADSHRRALRMALFPWPQHS